MRGMIGLVSLLIGCFMLTAACAPAASLPVTAATPARSPTAANVAPAATAPPPPAASKPDLPNQPVVDVKVGVVPTTGSAGFYVAEARGYFKDVGLNVELINASNASEQVAALAVGQLHAGNCAANVACYNAMNRRVDVQIVADAQSAGDSERSRGSNALVVRKDLWDDGTIRTPQDLVGRTIYLIPGPGAGHQAALGRWLRNQGVDPLSVEWGGFPSFPDELLAMQNGGIELGMQSEPLLSAGVARGIHRSMAMLEEIDPAFQNLYVMYWSGIDRLGPMVGERLMVGYLRGVRDYVSAFEYGVDQDAVIDVLTQSTTIKDPAVYRQIKTGRADPDGVPRRTTIESYPELFRELGVITTPIDLSQAFNDKYRQFAVQYLGEYRPPR